MLESLRKVGKEVGRELNRAWENLSEGWREILSRGNSALTHFAHGKEEESGALDFPRWGLLAGEVVESDVDVQVRLELPGMEKADCDIAIEGNTLVIRGEKKMERERRGDTYHVMERAYGSFLRAIPLPASVDADSAAASYKNGVLTVTLKKTGGGTAKRIEIQ